VLLLPSRQQSIPRLRCAASRLHAPRSLRRVLRLIMASVIGMGERRAGVQGPGDHTRARSDGSFSRGNSEGSRTWPAVRGLAKDRTAKTGRNERRPPCGETVTTFPSSCRSPATHFALAFARHAPSPLTIKPASGGPHTKRLVTCASLSLAGCLSPIYRRALNAVCSRHQLATNPSMR
jgi:hypothetical protein